MRQSIIILAFILSLNLTASATSTYLFPSYMSLDLEQIALEDELFISTETALEIEQEFTIESLVVEEVEEEVILNFDTSEYLPEDFNALEGKNEINWDELEIIEIEEEVDLGFNPKDYLPKNFNPYKGMHCSSKTVVVSLN